jgi:hypothetical protein
MKTKGCEVWDGYLAAGFRSGDRWTPTRGVAPDALWNRLKQRVALAARVDEFKADEVRCREALGDEWEIGMWRLWVAKLGIELPSSHYPGERLWPWSRGWTEDAVDTYLAAPVAARAA